MHKPAWDDLDAFFDPADFATPVVVELQDGTVRTFPGIFDDPYLNAQLGEYEADSSRPRVTCRESDVAGMLRGDVVKVAGRTYDLMSAPQGDGTGTASLELAPLESSF